MEYPKEYAYLLGLYLGDGCLSKVKTSKNGNEVWKLRIFQDEKYTFLIEECKRCIEKVLNCKSCVCNKQGCKEIIGYRNNLPLLFPQHGPGKKHERPIELIDWQANIVGRYPTEFIKGLIDSDGCRYTQQQGKYKYVYYGFTNSSDDIHRLFQLACNLIDVYPRRSGKTSTVSRKREVLILESFVGPKR